MPSTASSPLTPGAIDSSDSPTPLLPGLQLSWSWLVVQGALGVLFGLAALIFPIAALASFALLWGIWALLDGASSLIEAFTRGKSTGTRILLGVLGLVALGAGVFAVLRPFVTVAALTWVLGIWLLARGVGELVAVFGKHPAKVRVLLVLSALLDLALGVLFLLNPGRGAMSLTFVFGFLAIAWGAVALVSGIVLRTQKNELASDAGRHADVDGAVRTPVDPPSAP